MTELIFFVSISSLLSTQQTSAPPKTSAAAAPSIKVEPDTIVEGKATPTATASGASASGRSPSLNSNRRHGDKGATKEQKQQSGENVVVTVTGTSSPEQGEEKPRGVAEDKPGQSGKENDELEKQELSSKVEEKGREEGEERAAAGGRGGNGQGQGEGGEGVTVETTQSSSASPTSALLSHEQQGTNGDSRDSDTTI